MRLALAHVVVATAEAAHRSAGQLVEAVGALRVVEVPMGQQGQGDSATRLAHLIDDRGQMRLVERSWVDDDDLVGARLGEQPCVGAVERHR